MAGVAGLPETSNINGCDIKSSPIEPTETAVNPSDCRTSGTIGYTYFIRSGASIKIGSAADFKRRLGSLQTSSALPLEVLAVVPSSLADEFKVHQLFAGLRMRGEWFRADQELLYFIEQVKVEAKALADADAEIITPRLTPYQASLSLEARNMIRLLINTRKAYGAETPMGYCCSNLIEQIEHMATYKRPEWATHEMQTLPGLMKRQMANLSQLIRSKKAA